MKIQVVAILLFALSATEICEALNFFQKHVVRQMAAGDCNTKMRVINKQGECKSINTFFLDPTGVLNGICNHGNKIPTMAIDLTIIDCKHDKTYSQCTYTSVPGKATSVTVLCDQNNVPYHLQDVKRAGRK
ncbi:hypothetical protein AMECASPLE_016078 [Ameca splendens]|uniref:Ribonuclease A-domain domain-containing protein n=1 Tax=Ameca splendens TaxID=208324 RepID=A0ABV0Y2J4_9TELE